MTTLKLSGNMREVDIKKTSDMIYPLEAPIGWFLYHAKHEHTSITFRGDIHEPLPHAAGPWLVGFQKYPSGGRLTEARGQTLEEAWSNATKACQQVDLELMTNGQ